MTHSVTTRPATEQDDAFLFRLFQAVRLPEFAQLPLPSAQLDSLMRMQYNGQKHSYAASYPEGDRIVLVDGHPAGRLWVYQSATGHHLVDIALLPEFRNRGVGAELLERVIGDARGAGARLRCSVALTNAGSLRFHQRMGFQIVAQDGVYADLVLRDQADCGLQSDRQKA